MKSKLQSGFFAVGLLILASHAQAVSEAQLGQVFNQKILPHWNLGQEKTLVAADGLKLVYRVFAAANPSLDSNNALVIVPGRKEAALKYAELIYDLKDSPYTIYVLDLRGQGRSGRLTNNPQIGHVVAFDDYVADFDLFIDQVLKPAGHKKDFLIAHSLGGAITTLALERDHQTFSAVALVSPMFDFNSSPVPKALTYSLAKNACASGSGAHYAAGKKDWDANAKMTDDGNSLSQARFDMSQKIFLDSPELRLGGPSYQWVRESVKANDQIQSSAHQLVTTPVLMMDAGKDTTVHIKANQKFCHKAAHCEEKLYPESLHSILSERDFIRNAAISDILSFFARY